MCKLNAFKIACSFKKSTWSFELVLNVHDGAFLILSFHVQDCNTHNQSVTSFVLMTLSIGVCHGCPSYNSTGTLDCRVSLFDTSYAQVICEPKPTSSARWKIDKQRIPVLSRFCIYKHHQIFAEDMRIPLYFLRSGSSAVLTRVCPSISYIGGNRATYRLYLSVCFKLGSIYSTRAIICMPSPLR